MKTSKLSAHKQLYNCQLLLATTLNLSMDTIDKMSLFYAPFLCILELHLLPIKKCITQTCSFCSINIKFGSEGPHAKKTILI